jgi:hypothetical protein
MVDNTLRQRPSPTSEGWSSCRSSTCARSHIVHEIPAQQASFDAKYASSLASIPDGSPKTNGIAIGQSVATAIIALRSADGSTAIVPYTPGTGPGVWQPTPPAFLAAKLARMGQCHPFHTEDGLKQGEKVGRFAFKHYLKPVRGHDSAGDNNDDN